MPIIAAPLLAWYDGHARALPWRALPGVVADPYRVWLSEVMLQQTTVATVIPYFDAFTARWPTVGALAAASDADVMAAWAGLGYYSRARNLIACARQVASLGGFPGDEAGLRALPGIGSYSSAAIAAIAFGQRAVVVDGNVERVVSRLFAVATPLPKARPVLRALTDGVTPDARCGDFAQAMMDLGATICVPRSPRCLLCPLAAECRARAQGDQASYPRKVPKAARPVRHGIARWYERDGQVLLVRRPASGLMGGMRALPSSGWDGTPAEPSTGRSIGTVVHGFTHFRLELELRSGESGCASAPAGEWWDIAALARAGLPTLFRNAAKLAIGERDDGSNDARSQDARSQDA